MKFASIKAVLVGVASLGLFLGGCAQEPERDASGAITAAIDNADVFTIKLGDCVNNTAEGEMDRVPVVPCGEKHEAEVYAVTDLDPGKFPGRDALDKSIEEFCVPEFEKFVGVAYDKSELELYNFEPTAESWVQDDRELQCLVYDPEGATTGTLKNAKR